MERFDDALRRLAQDMLETMHDAPGVGLAAPQIGRSLRFFVWDDQSGSGPGALANPELIGLEGEQELEEGCLSVPGLYFPTTRAVRAVARGLDLDGKRVEVEAEGLLARILQHETDHINGTLFIDRLTGAHRREAMKAIRDIELGPSPQPRGRER